VTGWLFAGLRGIDSIHPAVVALPIGLLVAGVILDLIGVASRRDDPQVAGRWALWLGTATMGVALYTGLAAEEAAEPHMSAAAKAIMETHHNLGFVTLGIGVALSAWRLLDGPALPARWRPAYVAITLGMLATLLIGADLGGHLVFGHGVGVRSAAPAAAPLHE
jgi:uncharacterized membrane protein